jgi:hypothetical protein
VRNPASSPEDVILGSLPEKTRPARMKNAGQTIIMPPGINEDRTRRKLGLCQEATENAAVCVALLENPQVREVKCGRL